MYYTINHIFLVEITREEDEGGIQWSQNIIRMYIRRLNDSPHVII